MLRLKISLFTFVFCVFSLNAQKSINDYKYIVVPIQYDFQKGKDSYQVNSLTKYLFNKAGFDVYLSNEVLPEELRKNRCLSLTAKLVDNSKMLSTQAYFNLVDCNNSIIFSSIHGKSKEKDYKKSYHECVRESFEGIKALGYAYSGASNFEQDKEVDVVIKKSAVVKQGISNVDTKKNVDPVVVVGITSTSATVLNSVELKKVVIKEEIAQNVLYAQGIPNGFQLVDSTPKVLYIIQETTVKGVYIIKDNSGIIYKKNGAWKADFYRDGELISKVLNIKFF